MRPASDEGSERRRAVNLTLPGEFVDAARALGFNASQADKVGITAAVKYAREEAWLAANEPAIAAHADWLESFHAGRG